MGSGSGDGVGSAVAGIKLQRMGQVVAHCAGEIAERAQVGALPAAATETWRVRRHQGALSPFGVTLAHVVGHLTKG